MYNILSMLAHNDRQQLRTPNVAVKGL